jgi:recombination protein U
MQYPNKKKTQPKIREFAKLGMTLENDINDTNHFYLKHHIAVIHKKPTPVQVVKVSYPSRNKAKITEAYYKTPSTTDYNGIYKGYYLDFDCKETQHKTSLALSNIHHHQRLHLKDVHEANGIAFLIVHFKIHQTYFFIDYLTLKPFFEGEMDRKSIPYKTFLDQGILIPLQYEPRLDYLKAVDKFIQLRDL